MLDPIYKLLTDKGNIVKISGKDYVIKCLNPEHNDTNPSMRIDKISGIFRCPSCGYSGNIFKHYNILTSFVSIKIQRLLKLVQEVKSSVTTLDFPKGSSSFRDSYRGISSSTMIKFEAFTNNIDTEMEDRILFPIRNALGNITAFIGRHTLSNSGMRYRIFPTNAKLHCYPTVIQKDIPYIILVEGIFDMLNLYDKGMRNIVCTFGVSTLAKDTLKKLLPYKIQGISSVFIMYDGDKAGRTASKEYKEIISSTYHTEVINLLDGVDPGSLSQEEVDYYKGIIDEKSSNYR